MTDYAPNQSEYGAWRQERRRRLFEFQNRHPAAWNSLISVAIALDHSSPDGALETTLRSLLDQSWHNLEVALFPGDRPVEVETDDFLRLRGIVVCEGQDIGSLFRAGPSACGFRGDYVAIVPAGTVFEPSAFYVLNHAVVWATRHPEPQVVLFDHEFAEEVAYGEPIVYPALLPGFDPELLSGEDYVGSGALVRTELFDRLAGNAASMRTLLLAAAENDPSLACEHVREVLMRVPGRLPGSNEARWDALPAPVIGGSEGIAVIIPNRDKPELLQQCVESITAEREIRELIIVDNSSQLPKTRELYDRLERENGAKIVSMDHPFNFSRMINLGVAASDSDTILLLNNDIEFRKSGVLGRAKAAVSRPDVGIAGSILLYPDFTIQHAGILLDYAPDSSAILALHIGRRADMASQGYLGQYVNVRNCQAVTGAFMMMRRAIFNELEGFDEVALPVEYNDIDFCLRVRRAGYKVLCLPLPEVFHHEAASRGRADLPSVISMRSAAQRLMERRWFKEFRSDPFNHPIARMGEHAEVKFNFTGKFVL